MITKELLDAFWRGERFIEHNNSHLVDFYNDVVVIEFNHFWCALRHHLDNSGCFYMPSCSLHILGVVAALDKLGVKIDEKGLGYYISNFGKPIKIKPEGGIWYRINPKKKTCKRFCIDELRSRLQRSNNEVKLYEFSWEKMQDALSEPTT